MKKQVAIVYGWAEGQWQGRLLRKALHDAGFSVTTKTKDAEIIIAHSGGCFMLPKDSQAKLIMMIGLPYWPSKHPRQSLQEKLQLEIKNAYWIKKTIFNTFYFVMHPLRWYKMWRGWKLFKVPDSGDDTTIVAIRNKMDSFVHPDATEVLAKERGWHYQLFTGHHDDLWSNPKPYIDHLLASVSKK